MPTYDYKCEACGHAFEKFQSMSSAPIKKCPACGENRVKRLIGTGAAIIFKGGGFYQTDYRSDNYKKSEKAESGGGKSEGKSEGKSDGEKGGDKGKATAADAPAKSTESKSAGGGGEAKSTPAPAKSD